MSFPGDREHFQNKKNHISHYTYIKSRNIEDLLKSKKLIKEIKIIDENNYGAKLQNSIICFLEGDIGSAINELSDINNNTDITWRYNLGFLYAYKGDIPNALENYKKTFYRNIDGNVYLDTEVFMSDFIEKEPDKIQLYFFRGLLNYKIKEDYELAKNDFEIFKEKGGYNKFSDLKELNEKYLSEIKLN